jgi:hypothetical protein
MTEKISLCAIFILSSVTLAVDPYKSIDSINKFSNKLMSSDFRYDASTSSKQYVNGKEDTKGTTTSGSEFHMLRSGEKFLSQYWLNVSDGKKISRSERCEVSNDQYRFSLMRKNSAQKWVLKNIQDSYTPAEQKSDYTLEKKSVHDLIVGLSRIPMLDGSYCPLDNIESLPGYVKKETINTPIPSHVVIEFSYDVKPLYSSQKQLSSCRIELDTDFHSLPVLVTQSVQGTKGLETWTCKREWVELLNQEYMLTENKKYSFNDVGKGESHAYDITTKAKISLLTIPNSAFRLPAFGLPEPAGFESPSTPIYVWILATAGVCLGLFIAFRLLAAYRAKA